jgi:ppGpp synthetase/RelA/SpoT-type nucleotidyltranferase
VLPFTRSQIERLGVRLLAGQPQPADSDLAMLRELLRAYDAILEGAVSRVREQIGVTPTSRVKNSGTIVEKLERHGGSWLKSLQDIAGMRIVGDFDRAGQDALVVELVELFGDGDRAPAIVDRRAQPVQGYRAVHVIAFIGGGRVEVQVRTRWQHEWAEMFEKLADKVGRGIRYGEAPVASPPAWTIDSSPAERLEATETVRRLYAALIGHAQTMSRAVYVHEHGQALSRADREELRRFLAEEFSYLRRAIDDL